MANLKLVDAFTDFVEESTLPYRQMMTYYNCALMEVETKFKVLNEQFSLFYDRNPIESIHTRIKSQSSILKKLQKKNLALTIPNIENNLFDIAGVRVICSFTEDIYSLSNSFLSQDDVRLIEKKDYIQNPNFLRTQLCTPFKSRFCKQATIFFELRLYRFITSGRMPSIVLAILSK